MPSKSDRVKSIKDSFKKARTRDSEVRSQCLEYWSREWKINLLVALIIFIVMLFEKSDSSLWVISQLWGIPAEFAATCIGVFRNVSSQFVLTNGKRIKGTLFQMIAYYVSGLTPMYLCLVMRIEVDPVMALLYTPIVFVGILAYGAFMSAPNTLMSNGSHVTPLDMKFIQQNQILANIDPNKVPLTTLDMNVKTMTPLDWKLLKIDMELAGYDVSLK